MIFQFNYFSLQFFLDQNLTIQLFDRSIIRPKNHSQFFIQLFLGQNLTIQLFDRSIIWQKKSNQLLYQLFGKKSDSIILSIIRQKSLVNYSINYLAKKVLSIILSII